MPGTLAIAFNGTVENGQFMGDQICSIKAAYMFVDDVKPDKLLLAMSPSNQLHFLWQKFIDVCHAKVIYDDFHPGNHDQRWAAWDKWRSERAVNGIQFDHYRELYLRIHGGMRQYAICGSERGLGRRNIFEYFFFGQENMPETCAAGSDWFDDTLVYHPTYPADRGVYLAPLAKCQGNITFSFDFWERVVHRLIDAGITVTVNHLGNFCTDLYGHPLYRQIFPSYKNVIEEICRHKIVTCGNTGIGWMAFSCGVPVIAMQPPNSEMPDYRYEICGCKSLIEFLEVPDADYCARRLTEEVNRVTVLTTGCFDVIHAGHVRHLEESRALGTRLIVALNSDSSVNRLKGTGRPINPEIQRAAVLRALRCVDDVRLFDGDDAMPLIQELKPDVLTNGCDHKLEEIVGKEFVEAYGGRVVVTSGKREQSSTKIIASVIRQADVIKAIADGSTASVNPRGKLQLLASEFLSVCNLPGDVADLGAQRGGTSLILRRLAPNKELYVLDTWAGNPFDDPLCHHKKGEWASDLAECKSLVGVNERTHYLDGIFPYSADSLKERTFCFVLVDADTEQTTRDAIDFFWPRMIPGGKMFFDDYAWEPCAGVKVAVDKAFADEQRVVIPAQFTCVVTKR